MNPNKLYLLIFWRTKSTLREDNKAAESDGDEGGSAPEIVLQLNFLEINATSVL